MAFGDPVNHAHVDGASAASTSLVLGWATTAGNTLIVALRRGAGLGTTTTVTVSWDGGTTFPSTAALVKSQNVVSAGGMFLLSLPNITGAIANNTVVKVTFDSAQTCRLVVGEYRGNFAADQSNAADNGSTTSVDSGAITTTQSAALIGVAITGLNAVTTTPFTAGTSGITWAVEDELDHVGGSHTGVATVLANQSGGGVAGAGTYHFVGTLAAADTTGAIVASFTNASGAADPFPAGYGWLGKQQQNAVYRMRHHFYIPQTVLWLPERRHIVIEEQP